MKKYELLKDLPHAKAGTIFEGTDDGMVNTFQYATSTKDTYYLHRYTHPEWIKEVEEEKLCGCTVCCANRVEIKEERLLHTECQKGRNCPDCAEEREERQKELYQHVHTEDCICSKTSPIGKPVEEQEKEEWSGFVPAHGQYYFHPSIHGSITREQNLGGDDEIIEMGNAFETKEACEMELLLRKLMVKRYRPTQEAYNKTGDEQYYYWETDSKRVESCVWLIYHTENNDIEKFLIGNCFPYTEEGKKQCEAYGKQLKKVTDFLLDNK